MNVFDEIDQKFPRFGRLLSSYFNQDVESTDEGLNDFLQNPKEYIENFVKISEDFIKSELYSLDDKAAYIKDSVHMTLNEEPYKWFENVLNQLRNSLK